MTQLTAKTIEQVLFWIETTPHHRGKWLDEIWTSDKEFVGWKRFILEGHQDRLVISRELMAEMQDPDMMRAGDNMDRRMYRATETGISYLMSKGYRQDGTGGWAATAPVVS